MVDSISNTAVRCRLISNLTETQTLLLLKTLTRNTGCSCHLFVSRVIHGFVLQIQLSNTDNADNVVCLTYSLLVEAVESFKLLFVLKSYTGWAKSQFTYVGSYTNVVFYIRGLLLCRWHSVPTCSRIPSSNFENSNILDHAHSILKHLYCCL